MQAIIEKYHIKLSDTPTDFVRSVHEEIAWEEPLLALVGARGVGKSTLILQHIKLHDDIRKSLYVSADDLWFADHTLYELADKFYKEGGLHLYIDEIHKYRNWSQEIKNINDTFSRLKVVYTGSSILDLQRGNADLSRRLIEYHLYGLSFREYMEFGHGVKIPVHTLEDLLHHEIRFPFDDFKPLRCFKEYLKSGYYPYYRSAGYYIRLTQVVNRILESDIPAFTGITPSTVEKLKKLLYIIIQSVPFKPNYSRLGRDIDVSRNNVSDLIVMLSKADLINVLRQPASGLGLLGKVDKVYLSNPNISYALADSTPDLGNVRETIFLASTKVKYKVYASKESDFEIDGNTFEVGGKNKSHRQIRAVRQSYVVKDDIERGFGNELPLWTFGLLY